MTLEELCFCGLNNLREIQGESSMHLDRAYTRWQHSNVHAGSEEYKELEREHNYWLCRYVDDTERLNKAEELMRELKFI